MGKPSFADGVSVVHDMQEILRVSWPSFVYMMCLLLHDVLEVIRVGRPSLVDAKLTFC